MFIRFIRKYIRSFSVLTLIIFCLNVFTPSIAYAIDGPKQPEVKTFTPVSTADMVDPFTGNFNYNIPLLDVGGYPVNLAYTANPSMDQDASWVGLGWNINVGNIDRSMRGLPDDFSGDSIVKVRNQRINQTMGVTASFDISDLEIYGLELGKLGLSAGASLGVFRNNYTGNGSVAGLNLGLDLALASANKDSKTLSLGASATSNSDDGTTISPSLSYTNRIERDNGRSETGSFAIGSSFNTKRGWQELSLNYSLATREHQDPQSGRRVMGDFNGSVPISFAQPAMPPMVSMPTFSMGLSFNTTFGGEAFGLHAKAKIRANYSQQSLKDDIAFALPMPDGILVPGFIPNEEPISNILFNIPSLFKSNAKVVLPAYGYLYAQNAQSEKALLDFNREKEGAFTIHRPNLPIPNFTHDVYSVTGQGISGMYRPFRNDIGMLHDPDAESSSANIDLPGLEIGAGNMVHVGANLGVTTSTSATRKWDPGISGLGFNNFDPDNPFYQPYYFKQAGEKTADFSRDFFNNVGGFDPVRVKLGEDLRSIVEAAVDPLGFFPGDATVAVNEFQKEKLRSPLESITITGGAKPYRQPRNQDIQFLNAYEASKFGVEKYIRSYPLNKFTLKENGAYQPSASYTRASSSVGRRAHHISEVTALRSDGKRYVFGIPVYNKYQKDVSFAVECSGEAPEPYKTNCERGMITYSSGMNSTGNDKGIDNHYESQEMPAYPHSFLLTSILSDDYVDVKDDGPSDDDPGSYTKFNYTKTASNNKWRAPFEANSANYSPGFNSDRNDGRGSYVYGERELWYLHSIETKTHVAEFILSDRQDAIGVQDENGGPGSGRMKKLVRIDLYAKPDKLKQAKSKDGYVAVPLKSVHFEYDYSLCPGIPNNTGNQDPDMPGRQNQGGKLTLKKIFFTYQNSNKWRLSPYEFRYAYTDDINSSSLFNPVYTEKSQDRWGTYKPVMGGGTSCETQLTNTDFPYAEQDKAKADQNAAAWNLTKIILPSGAIINVTYESDDYAFVQNKPAMQMFTIAGMGSDKNAPVSEWVPVNDQEIKSYLFFKLTEPLDASLGQQGADSVVRARYLKEIAAGQEKLYFRCFVNMNGIGYDYVPGYADIDNSNHDGYGAVMKNGSSSYNYGFIKIKGVKAGSASDFNPITKSAINLVKMSIRTLLKDEDDIVNCPASFGNDVKEMILSTAKLFNVAGAAQLTYDHFASGNSNIGKTALLHKSMIRLYNPYQNKRGGGSRVKMITMSDEWNAMAGSPTSIYGQTFEYTKPDGLGGVMSSGVAAYEPVVGGEENPFRQPVFFDEERLGVPDEEYFLETPMGESFFPGPSVGYSRVTVKDISVTGNGEVVSAGTGKVVHEFYTAYDFPTYTDDTHLEYRRHRPTLLAQLLKLNVEDYVTVSQGYVVELNDMHGKPRSQQVYQETQTVTPGMEESPLSSLTYLYKTDPATGRLDNDVLVMNRTAVPGKNEFIESRTVGVDYDFITDFRENETSTTVVTVQGNVETFFAAIFPIVIPVVLPEFQSEKVRFRSAVTSKVINRYGLLERTISQDLGKQDTLRNVLYDAETGGVLLTQNKNEFDDSVYVFSYPAHFAYEGMGPAYKNSGVMVKTGDLENITNAADYFMKGDELLVYNKDSADLNRPAYYKGWVSSVGTNGNISIIDKDGWPIVKTAGDDGHYVIKVLRSGRRNLQSSSAGRIVTLKNPLVDSNNDKSFDSLVFDKVLDANMMEYDNHWKIFCNCDDKEQEVIPGSDIR